MACSTIAIGLLLASHHFADYKYNNFNPGLAGQCDHIEAGAYYNSERRMSEFVAYRGEWWTLGVVRGYNGKKWMPGGTVYKNYGIVELNAAPFIETHNGRFHDIAIVVNASLRWELKK